MPGKHWVSNRDQVAGFLLFNQHLELCEACLATTLDLSLDEVKEAATTLGRSRGFLRDRWRCSRCERVAFVVRALSNSVIASSNHLRLRRIA